MVNNKVTVCITYYNQAEFVRQSLDSVLAISFPGDFEILCGDDGSSDETLDIIKEYCAKYPNNIRYFVMDRNDDSKLINRASSNRLNLAEHAKGDYILFLDGDDFYCDTSFVTEAIEILMTHNHVIGCAFNFKYLYQDGKEQVFEQFMNEGEIYSRDYIAKRRYTHSGAIVFKNILNKEKIDFLRNVNIFDDNAITIYMLQFGNLFYTNRPVYTYRQSDDSLWNSFSEIERSIWNAMDYNLICKYAPAFAHSLAKRQYHGMRYLYRNKHNIIEKLGEKYNKYLSISENNNDYLVHNLLRWKHLTIIKKFCVCSQWIKYKIKARLP